MIIVFAGRRDKVLDEVFLLRGDMSWRG